MSTPTQNTHPMIYYRDSQCMEYYLDARQEKTENGKIWVKIRHVVITDREIFLCKYMWIPQEIFFLFDYVGEMNIPVVYP